MGQTIPEGWLVASTLRSYPQKKVFNMAKKKIPVEKPIKPKAQAAPAKPRKPAKTKTY